MRCFAISRSLVDSRLDPLNFINPAIAIIAKSQLPLLPIGDVALSMKAGFAAGKQDQAEEGDAGILQIRPTNMSEEGELHFDKSLSVKSEIVRAKKINAIKRKTILFNNTNSQEWVGKTAFFDLEGEYVTSNHITSICVDEKKVSPKYLWIVLNTLHRIKYFYNVCTNWNNQSGVNVELLRQIKIPVPDRAIQDQIVALMDKAYAEKKALEAEADKLLASIDSYMLDQLGVVLSGHAARKIYTVSSKAIEGKRVDPLYYSQEILSFIGNLTYDHPKIADCMECIQSGFAAGRGDQELEKMDEAIIQIRPTNMNNFRELVFDKNVYVNKDILNERPDHLIRKGEVLFNNTNSQDLVGKSVFFDIEGEYVCSNHVTRLYPKVGELDSYYLYCVLNLYQRLRVFYSICTNWNNQSGVGSDLLGSLPIPKPHLAKQEAIAKEIRSRIEKAAEFRKKSSRQIAQAKAEVEKIIFGA